MLQRNNKDKNCHDEILVLNTQKKGDEENTKCVNEPEYEGNVITSSQTARN